MDQENQHPANASSSKSATESANTQKKVKRGGLSFIKLIIGIVIIVAIAFGAWYAFGEGKDESNNITTVIATVNSEEISATEFEEFFTRQKTLIGDLENDADEAAFKEQILDLLISKTLLLQKVSEADIELTEEDLETQLAQVRSQFPDEETFDKALSEQGFTQETFADALREDLVIQKYIDSQVDISSITVTDEEVQAEYDLAITRQDNLPGIDVLGDPIRAQLLQEKQQKLIAEFIENLKKESDIKITS